MTDLEKFEKLCFKIAKIEEQLTRAKKAGVKKISVNLDNCYYCDECIRCGERELNDMLQEGLCESCADDMGVTK